MKPEQEIRAAAAPAAETVGRPIDMVLHCPKCGLQHIDEPDERSPGWTNPPHKSHLCHGCLLVWRAADIPTNGVKSLPSGKGIYTAPTAPAELADELRSYISMLRLDGKQYEKYAVPTKLLNAVYLALRASRAGRV